MARLALVAAGGLARVVLIDVRPDVDERHASKLHAVAANLCAPRPLGALRPPRRRGRRGAAGPVILLVPLRGRFSRPETPSTRPPREQARDAVDATPERAGLGGGKLERDVSTGEIRGI